MSTSPSVNESVSPKVESSKEAPQKVLTGLCSTCVNASSCIYLHNQEDPILYCEGFECEVPTVVEEHKFRISERRKSEKAFKELEEAELKEQGYTGLCVN